MLQLENLLLALAIVAGAFAWYRTGFRAPRVRGLPESAPRRAVAACGWMLIAGIALKSAGPLLGDGRIQVAQAGPQAGPTYAYRSREPGRFWRQVVGELLLLGATGACLVFLGRKPAPTPPDA